MIKFSKVVCNERTVKGHEEIVIKKSYVTDMYSLIINKQKVFWKSDKSLLNRGTLCDMKDIVIMFFENKVQFDKLFQIGL